MILNKCFLAGQILSIEGPVEANDDALKYDFKIIVFKKPWWSASENKNYVNQEVFNARVIGNAAKELAETLKPGDWVLVEGKLHTRHGIIAKRMQFIKEGEYAVNTEIASEGPL